MPFPARYSLSENGQSILDLLLILDLNDKGAVFMTEVEFRKNLSSLVCSLTPVIALSLQPEYRLILFNLSLAHSAFGTVRIIGPHIYTWCFSRNDDKINSDA